MNHFDSQTPLSRPREDFHSVKVDLPLGLFYITVLQWRFFFYQLILVLASFHELTNLTSLILLEVVKSIPVNILGVKFSSF